MCGLVAIVSKRPSFGFSRDELDAFKTMLFLDTLRGEDSTGIFGVDNRGNVSIAKEATDAFRFMDTPEYRSIDSKMFRGGFALVGHNRKATRGSITDQNAHPFWVNDEVVLVHNGTFYGDHKNIADVEVDSHALTHAIAKEQPDSVEKAFEKINAAYATIWYDVRDGSINFLRNSQRPLWGIQTPSAWLICSEKEMIEFAVARHKLNLANGSVYMSVKEGVLQKLKNKDNSLVVETKEVKGYKTATTSYNGVFQQQTHTPHRSQQQQPSTALTTIADAIVAAEEALNNPAANAWNNHVETKSNVIALPAPSTDKSSVRRDSITEFQKAIITDMPEGAFNEITYSKYMHIREVFTSGSSCYFNPSNIVQFDAGRYILYGKLTTQDNVIGFTLISEDDFTKLINIDAKIPELHGKVRWTNYVNVVDDGERPEDWHGFALVRVDNPVKIEENEYGHSCSC
ncbi:MAG TPA: hypothetical protein VFM18_02880 [Methanosarcina sp.]|nr:hypothetical protein [Methanosarcina sp.]